VEVFLLSSPSLLVTFLRAPAESRGGRKKQCREEKRSSVGKCVSCRSSGRVVYVRAARSSKVIVDAASFSPIQISNVSALNGISLFQA
jgi:hypothetical protein